MAEQQQGAAPSNNQDMATKKYVDDAVVGATGTSMTSNTGTSVDSEVALFSSTGGNTIKRATGNGIATLTSGVLSAVTAPSGTIVGTSDSQSLTNKTLDNTNTVTLKDTNFTLQDSGDTTKQALFDASLIATGTSKTFSLPENTGTLATRVKSGKALPSGGSQQYGVPGTVFSPLIGTWTYAANTVFYYPFYNTYPVTITDWLFEVTTGPSGASNVRIGLYQADANLQPTGNVVYDSGAVAVANAFTGTKTATSLSIALTPGTYLTAVNVSVGLAMRIPTTYGRWLNATIGASPIHLHYWVAQTNGAFPSPGTAWTSTTVSVAGCHPVFFKWTE